MDGIKSCKEVVHIVPGSSAWEWGRLLLPVFTVTNIQINDTVEDNQQVYVLITGNSLIQIHVQVVEFANCQIAIIVDVLSNALCTIFRLRILTSTYPNINIILTAYIATDCI